MSEELEILEQHLKNRSHKFIKLANLSLCIITGVIILGISFYFYGGKFAISKSLELKKEKVAIIKDVTDRQLKEIISQVNEKNLSKEKYYQILSKFRHDLHEMSRSMSEIEKNHLLIFILAIGGTIGLIFIQAFLIHVLESFYKYNKKLGAYFKGRADSAKYAGTTIVEEEETLAKFIVPDNFSYKGSIKKQAPQTKDIAKKNE